MIPSRKSAAQFLLRGVAWFMLVLAGLAFWFGGRLISELTKADRVFAEVAGIGLAVVLGVIAKSADDRSAERKEDEPKTSSE
jgi:hypothetical protein